MIVGCERCETRFKLDESRLPARGARVRCSRCKHAFFVTPPGSPPEALVHEVAAAAARAPAESLRGPEPSWDMEENPDATVARRKPPAMAPRPPEEEASDWHFEDEVPGLDPGATRSSSFDLGGAQAPPSLAAAPDPNEDSLATLGDPETWDLLAGEPPLADAPALPPPAPEPVPADIAPATGANEQTAPALPAPGAAVPADTPTAPAPAARTPRPPAAARMTVAPPPLVMPRRIPPAPRGVSAQSLGGWAAAVALAAALAWVSLGPVAAPGSSSSLAPVSGFEVSEAQAHVLENAAAGPVLVVSGRLRNPGSSVRPLGAPLAVQLLDARGVPLAVAPGAAGPALPDRRVREEAPEQLVTSRDAAALASAPVAAGGDLAFTAVFAPAPRGAARFALGAGASGP